MTGTVMLLLGVAIGFAASVGIWWAHSARLSARLDRLEVKADTHDHQGQTVLRDVRCVREAVRELQRDKEEQR